MPKGKWQAMEFDDRATRRQSLDFEFSVAKKRGNSMKAIQLQQSTDPFAIRTDGPAELTN
jgi:hypothetical protein